MGGIRVLQHVVLRAPVFGAHVGPAAQRRHGGEVAVPGDVPLDGAGRRGVEGAAHVCHGAGGGRRYGDLRAAAQGQTKKAEGDEQFASVQGKPS
jgi:hypothetical protein